MKDTTAYRSEYLVVTCPYCGEVHYCDTEDDPGEGRLPEEGRKMDCRQCKRTMRVLPPC